MLVSGFWWGAGVYFLPPLPVTSDTVQCARTVPTAIVQKVTYFNLLFARDPITVVEIPEKDNIEDYDNNKNNKNDNDIDLCEENL